MSKYDDSYEDRILKVKADFLNALKENLETRSDDEKVDQQEIRKIVYKFIFDKLGKGLKVEKEMKELFTNTIDFCLSYGFIIIETLGTMKKYYDSRRLKISDDIIDA